MPLFSTSFLTLALSHKYEVKREQAARTYQFFLYLHNENVTSDVNKSQKGIRKGTAEQFRTS